MTRTITKSIILLALPLSLSLGACTGVISDPGASPDGLPPDVARRGPDGGACTGPACVPTGCEGVCIGASGLARLTRAQYRNAVRDIFGVSVDATRLPPDHLVAGTFDSNEPADVTTDDVDRYAAMAEDATRDMDVVGLTACTGGEAPAACGARFIDTFGPHVHRHPLGDGERAEYVDLLEWSIAEGDSFEEAIRLVATAFLQAPSFLYRIERATEGAATPLDGYAMASRLSYFLWQTTPDGTLMAAAAAGELDEAVGMERHARRMLADAKADVTLRTFHRSWLGIGDVDQISRTDPSFDEALGRAMRSETDAFVVHVFREAGGSLPTLLGADYSIVDAEMASFYGVDAPTGSAAEMRALPNRRGLLTQASVMAANAADSVADPVYRGKFIRTRVLCQGIGGRPDGVDDAVMMREGMIDESMSERDRLDILTSGAECQGCHRLMNGPGFAFSKYDSIGRFRTVDDVGQPVDTTFELLGEAQHASDANGAYADATELAGALSESADVASCVAAQWMRFALGRDTLDEGTSYAAAVASLDASDRDLRELVVAITTTDAFRHRLAR